MDANTAILDELKDIRDISIDLSMPIETRRKSYIEQIRNPYRFKYNDMIACIQFTGETPLEEKIVDHFIKKAFKF